MSHIYVFGQDDETNDYSTMGLVGALIPTECKFIEKANGDSLVNLKHPIDDFGRHTTLRRGNILVIPVPVRTTPEIQNGSCVTTVWTYKVKPLNQLTSKNQRTLYKKSTGSGKMKVMNAGDVVTVVQLLQDENARWKVKSKYGTGWIDPNGFELVTEHSLDDNSHAIEEIQSPWRVTDQYFRIYQVNKTLDGVSVSARRIHYDLLKNATRYKTEAVVNLQTALDGILDNCYSSHEFKAYTNVLNTQAGLFYQLKNPIDAFINLEYGLCSKFDVCLVPDNYELFFLHDPGLNRGVRIQYRKNMLGISFDYSDDEVATRIVPSGEKKDGTELLLDANPTLQYIDSPNINAYPIIHVYHLTCDNCKIGSKDENGGTITEATAKARMRAQVQKLLDNGCDQPKISMSVEFINLGDTEEYSQFKDLENCFLFDYVIVQHEDLDIDVTARIVGIEWDCLTDRMSKIEVGNVGKTLANTGITSWQIPNGFSGSKIGSGTLGNSAFKEDIISTRHVQAGSINTDALQAHSVTATKLDAETINAYVIDVVSASIDALTAGDIETSTLYAAFAHLLSLAAGSITAGTISSDQLASTLGVFISLFAKTGTFDFATVQNFVGGALSVDRVGATMARITNLVVTQANLLNATIGNLIMPGTDGKYYRILIGSDGVLTTEEVIVTPEEIAAGGTEDGNHIVQTIINAESINGEYLNVQSAIIGTILTRALSTGQITASEAFIASAIIPELYTTVIKAIGDTIDIKANTSVQILLGQTTTLQEGIDYILAYDSEDPPPAPILAGKIWRDRGVDPFVDRRWRGFDIPTGREYLLTQNGDQLKVDNGYGTLKRMVISASGATGEVSVKRTGKNVVLMPITSETKNGITATYDSNSQTYTFNGTCTVNNTVFNFSGFPNINFPHTWSVECFLGTISRVGDTSFLMAESGWVNSVSVLLPSAKGSVTVSNAKTYGSGGIRFDSGSVATNYKVRIQLEYGLFSTDYEPYMGYDYVIPVGQSIDIAPLKGTNILLSSVSMRIDSTGSGWDIINDHSDIRALLKKWFTFSNDEGLIIRKPAYVDENGISHPASIWRTTTDEVGYRIWRNDMAEPVGSFVRNGLITDSVQLGNNGIVARKTGTGGWVWTDE